MARETDPKIALILREALERKALMSAGYSMRALARDLGVSSGYLSQVFQGKKKLAISRVASLARLLGMSAEEQVDLTRRIAEAGSSANEVRILMADRTEARQRVLRYAEFEADEQALVADWYHVAILDLASTHDFLADPDWIAKRLGLKPEVVRAAVERLIRLELVEKLDDGNWRKVHHHMKYLTRASRPKIRQFHSQMIEKAKQELQRTSSFDFQNRNISSVTFAVDMDRVAEAKTKIEKFKDEMAEFLTDSEKCSEVFQLNVQLFPLTKIRKSKKGEKSCKKS